MNKDHIRLNTLISNWYTQR